jgi:hypothetical protein
VILPSDSFPGMQLFTVLNAQLDEKDQSDMRGLPPPDELIHLSFDRLTFTLPNGQIALEGMLRPSGGISETWTYGG